MHPIAGQGFNVSVRDIECLSDAVAKAVNSGQDPGATTLLHAYAKRRWPDIAAMLAATDGLNRLFMTNLPPVALGRRLGIAAVDRIPPLKRRFQRHAMGLSLFGKA
jgi:2-octaprenyl-6-methoxyphenol hydroxylase